MRDLTAVLSEAERSGCEPGELAFHCIPVASPRGQELYLTAEFTNRGQFQSILLHASEIARRHQARICRQRVFVPQGEPAAGLQAEQRAFSEAEQPLQDWLCSGGAVGVVQCYLVAGVEAWSALGTGDTAGCAFTQGQRRWALTGGVHAPAALDRGAQVRACFLRGEELLREAEMTLHDVARTWIYLEDILAWYPQLNQARNALFVERGLLARGRASADSPVPASTGMGVAPACHQQVAIEFFAGVNVHTTHHAAAGQQRAAYEYGSAFARAAEMDTPAGRTLFVSGTAAIDAAGRTCHVDDSDGQITMTLENVQAVLERTGFAGAAVVEAIAYCKSAEVAEQFCRKHRDGLTWPWAVVIGDVCRDDLLFEVEVTACRAEGTSL